MAANVSQSRQIHLKYGSQLVNPDIEKHNVKVGDFIKITPNRTRSRIFLVSEIDQDNIYIHPGSREDQMLILTPGYSADQWILKKLNYKFITDWSSTDPMAVRQIDITWIPSDTSQIRFIPQDDPEVSDYRLIREKITEYATLLEQDTSLPLETYRVRTKEFFGHRNLVFKAKTYLGALVSYMNWLDTQSIHYYCNEMIWDQVDPYRFNIGDYDSIETLAKAFEDQYDNVLKECDEQEVVLFPGPKTNLVKPARS